MADNTICMKRVGELQGMKFSIPDYQRGYRWTKQQAKDLLDDIEEFRRKNEDGIYCLQPLVVRETIDNETEFGNEIMNLDKPSLALIRKTISNHTRWDVIDGQQRLTTIFILLKYLTGVAPYVAPYEIKYETRGESEDFLKNLSFGSLDNSNVDYYHMSLVAETIEKWFGEKSTEFNDNYDKFKEDYKKTIIERVKFIWYEAVEEDAIKVFTRLNIGKIKLTNAELIKALFLNRSNFDKENKDVSLRQLEIANEWDHIEYTLQSDEFWLFLHPTTYQRPTRIDFIFDLICEADSLKVHLGNKGKVDIDSIGTDEYKTFRYFYEYFHRENFDMTDYWKEVKKYFNIFQEWFSDLVLYHYVGYLIALKDNKPSIEDLVDKWTSFQKNDFIVYLKDEIRKKVKDYSDLDKQYEIDNAPSKTKCKPVLLLHNIQTIINQNKQLVENDKYKLPIFYKFPFHLYKLENWDVEHIDSNTTNDLTKEKDQRVWLQEVLHENIILKQELLDDINKLLGNKDKKEFEEQFKAVWEEINEEIENEYPEEKLSQQDKNKIWNFCLLDAGTNRSYGNAIFPVKRRKIIAKEQGRAYEIDEEGDVKNIKKSIIAFVPPVTQHVFLKYYSVSKAQFLIWGKSDAEAYRSNIAETLKEFGINESNTINDQTNENNGNE